MYSYGLGGGSIITTSSDQLAIGPQSVGYQLQSKSLAFGGDTFTTTDLAVLTGRLKLGTLSVDALEEKVAEVTSQNDVRQFIQQTDRAVHEKLITGILKTLASMENVPESLILVGGGASLFSIDFLKKRLSAQFKKIVIPSMAGVANATGAAIAQIEGKYVHIYDYASTPRKQAIQEAIEKAEKIAISKGAIPSTVRTMPPEEIPLNYLTGDPNQLTIKVVGELGLQQQKELQEDAELEWPEMAPTTESKKIEMQPTILNFPPVTMPEAKSLSKTDIEDIATGSGLLGSGGGGNPALGALMATNVLNKGAQIKMISSKNLPDDANVVAFGIMGSPSAFYERTPSLSEAIEAIHAIEKTSGKKVNALLLMEGGGANATIPLLAAATLGVPVVDADCMGRAFPGINMVTPNIYGTFDEHVAAVSNGRQVEVIQLKQGGFSTLENKAREATVKMGGIVHLAYLPMKGSQVKQWAIKGTLSTARKIGCSLRKTEGKKFSERLATLNHILDKTDYKRAEPVFKGRIVNLRKREMGGFSLGGFVVKSDDSERELEVGFQNENLVARDAKNKRVVVQVPDLITVVDQHTLKAICCEDLTHGAEVVILKMNAPKLMSEGKALEVVGPKAYPMEKIFELLNDNTLQAPLS